MHTHKGYDIMLTHPMETISVSFDQSFLTRVAHTVWEMTPRTGKKMHDASRVIVVLPGMRAGRRLREIMTDIAHTKKLFLLPPHIYTPRGFCLSFVAHSAVGACASLSETRAAWVQACANSPDAVQRIRMYGDMTYQDTSQATPDSPAAAPLSPSALFSLARTCMTVYTTLSGERVTCADVQKCLASNPRELARWQAFESLTDTMRNTLASAGLMTQYDAVEKALTSTATQPENILPDISAIVVAGVVDPFAQFTACLDALSDRVVIMSYGLEGNTWFDTYGALRDDAEVAFPLIDDVCHMVRCSDSPATQVNDTVAWLHRVCEKQSYAITDIVIGVPDAEVTRPLEAALAAEEITTHDAVGLPFLESNCGILLTSLTALCENPSWENAVALLRHPVYERYLRHALPDGPLTAENYAHRLGILEEYLAAYAVPTLFSYMPDASGESMMNTVNELTDALHTTCAYFPEQARTIRAWLPQINACLMSIYKGYAHAEDASLSPYDRDALEQWAALSHEIESNAVDVTYEVMPAVALRYLLGFFRGVTLTPERTTAAIDLVGWLELAMDDAPVIVVTGMNDGRVSENTTSDAFLPDHLRRRLGVAHTARRARRDRYIMRTLLAGDRQCLFTAGRASNNGDPLRISRILCDMSPTHVAELLLSFYAADERSSTDASYPSLTYNAKDRAPLTLAPPDDTQLTWAGDSLRVTDFSLYLICPYKWYLHRTIGEPPPTLAHELNAAEFGSFVHDILAHFGRQGPHSSDNENTLIDWFDDTLDRRMNAIYGAQPSIPLHIQKEMIRARLHAFAEAHAHHMRDGWKIKEVEYSVSSYIIAGMPIHGRIDRIDQHDEKGFLLLDYKTSTKAKTPEKVHLAKGMWRDLQLPLYRDMMCQENAYGPDHIYTTGYCVLPAAPQETGILCAQWQDDDYLSALACAADVVARITSGADDAFVRTENINDCVKCDYRHICQRA